MPVAHNPNKPEFYVYHFVADGVSFYVGHGRSGRAPMRLSYVRRLERNGTLSSSDLSNRAFGALLRAGCKVQLAYVANGLVKSEAGIRETAELHRLVSAGAVLANIRSNPRPPNSCEAVVQWVLAHRHRKCAAFGPARPIFVSWTADR